jgi:Transposase DDE domain
LADRGLVGHPLVQLCQQRGWHYILRVSAAHTCQPQRGRWARTWLACQRLVPQRGRQWYGSVRLWQERPLPAQISATWEPGQKEPWIVVSDRPAGRQRVREYARRMRVESTFQDLKRRGWDLEGTVIADRARLDRLLLVLFLALWWLAHLAASCIHHGQRARFDRHDRRDKGIFRLGRLWLLDMLRRMVTETSLTRCLPFRKTPTGWAYSLRF